MLPLVFAREDADLEIVSIKKSKYNDSLTCRMENMGFVKGAKLRIVSRSEGNLIIKIKDYRAALGEDIAKKIIVKEV